MYTLLMSKKRIDANIRCPSCGGQLYPRVLVCDSCGLKVEGEFVSNEFGTLTPDELHFLRVFIYCEGSIRDMEAALGVSYPTVKGHLASIKEKLNLSRDKGMPVGKETTAPSAGAAPTPDEVLDKLEAGEVDPGEAVRLLKSTKKKGARS
jgi:hypothetical protein